MKRESEQESGGGSGVEDPSRKELLEELARLDSTLDRLPYPSDLAEMSDYSAAAYRDEFGSWDEALKAAGIDKGEELLAELQRVTDELGKKPSQSEMNSLGKYSSSMYARYFGQWSSAKEQLDDWDSSEPQQNSGQSMGNTPQHNSTPEDSEFIWNTSLETSEEGEKQEPTQTGSEGRDYTTDELLDYLQELEELFGESPSKQFVHEYGSYPVSAYIKRFGSWDNALDAAGLPSIDREIRTNRKFTRVEILDKLVEYAGEVGEVPEPLNIYRNTDLYAIMVSDRFGSLSTALDLAGITDDAFDQQSDRSENVDQTVSPDRSSIVSELRRLGSPPTDPPNPFEFERESILSMVTVREFFDTWLNALEEAGYDREAAVVDRESAQGYTREELLEEIRRVTIHIGAVPTSSDFDRIADMTTQTVKNQIGSWETALEKAGVRNLSNSEINELWQEYKLPDSEALRAEAKWVDEAVAGRTTSADIRTFARYPESYFEEVFGSISKVLDSIKDEQA